MPDLTFAVTRIGPRPHTLTPVLDITLAIAETQGVAVDSIALQCQIQVEAGRRPYSPAEQEAVLDLFGPPARWGRTLRTMLWTHVGIVVPGFEGATEVALPVPCTHDLTIAAGKYFFALEDGEVPLTLQFSGSVFWRDPDGQFRATPIPWDREAEGRLPVATWRAMMDEHDSDTAWLCLQRRTVDGLNRYKNHLGVPSFDLALERLLAAAEEGARA